MALKARISSLEGLPEDVKREYKPASDGGFMLDVEPVNGFSLENVSGLKNALGEERTNVTRMREQLAAFAGVDPKAAKEALARLDEIKNFNPEDKVSAALKVREQAILDGVKKTIEDLKAESNNYKTQLTSAMITDKARAALAAAGAKNADVLLPHVVSKMKLITGADGKLYPRVMDDNGGERVGPTGDGAPMTVEQFCATLRDSETFSFCFNPLSPSGSGAGGAKGKSSAGSGDKGGKKVIDVNDRDAFADNLEAIANGDVEVTGAL